jgi:hypothetical protein
MKANEDCKQAKDEHGNICNPLQCTGDYIVTRMLLLSRDLKGLFCIQNRILKMCGAFPLRYLRIFVECQNNKI